MSYTFAVYAGALVVGYLLQPRQDIDLQTVVTIRAWMMGIAVTLGLLAIISAIEEKTK